jgi:ADP-dependent NAD(P)H-hydrate dehydratase
MEPMSPRFGFSPGQAAALPRQRQIPSLPPRPAEAHKGMFGHGWLVGGSRGMSGAITLAGQAALRCGAGRITIAVPTSTQATVAVANPCAMTHGIAEATTDSSEERNTGLGWLESSWMKLVESIAPGTVLGIGPGLSRHPTSDRCVLRAYAAWPGPAVFDADALNALASSRSWSESEMPPKNAENAKSAPAMPRILTPHPGEWARLTGVAPNDMEGQRDAAVACSKRLGIIVVLKGHRTFVTNGDSAYENTTGNPSLAVGGSGDTLTGMIVAFLCQGLSGWEAAILGVYLHGLAGDLAHADLGTPSTLPTDLVAFLPAAFRAFHSSVSTFRL